MKLKRRIIILFSFLIVFSALSLASNYFKNQPQKNIENVFSSATFKTPKWGLSGLKKIETPIDKK